MACQACKSPFALRFYRVLTALRITVAQQLLVDTNTGRLYLYVYPADHKHR